MRRMRLAFMVLAYIGIAISFGSTILISVNIQYENHGFYTLEWIGVIIGLIGILLFHIIKEPKTKQTPS
jgi:hypothetical protein